MKVSWPGLKTLSAVNVLNNVSGDVTGAPAAFSEPDLNVYAKMNADMMHTLVHVYTQTNTSIYNWHLAV